MAPNPEDEYEALLQFLYMAPIGIVQARSSGEIVMVNPLCAQLLLPLSPGVDLSNLFDALEGVAPQLRRLARDFTAPYGKICDTLQLHLPPSAAAPRVLSLTLLKLDSSRLMATLSDITQAVQRERDLQRSRAWIDNIVTALPDYAFVPLDGEGRVAHWNPSIGRITGFAAEAVVGHSFAVFSPPDARSDAPADAPVDARPDGSPGARLRQADGNGWSLAEGWSQRADGSRFWGSCLIAPLQAPEGALAQTAPEARAYSLILRPARNQPDAPAVGVSVGADLGTGATVRASAMPAADTAAQWTAVR